MAKSTDSSSADWGKLVALPEEERTASMADLFIEIHSLDEGTRESRLDTIIRGEHELSDDLMASLSRSRLLAWLSMDKAMATQVAEEFQTAMDGMPGKIAMKHATMDQTVSLHFDSDQVTLLAELDPKIFRSMPGVAIKSTEPEAPAAPESSPWWKFW
jgi:hypothetical protein